MAPYLADRVDRPVRPARLRGRRDQVLGRDRPRPDDGAERAPVRRYALAGSRAAGVQADCTRSDARPPRRDAVVRVHRDTEPEAISSCRGAHRGRPDGRRCPTRRATGRFTATTARTLKLHPFLRHYQTLESTAAADRAGRARRLVGGSGTSRGLRALERSLEPYAGKSVEVSADGRQRFARRSSAASTSTTLQVRAAPARPRSEDDDGHARRWTVPAHRRQPGQPERLVQRHGGGRPPSVGTPASARFARQPEILRFLSDLFGPYRSRRRLDRRRRPYARLRARETRPGRSTRPRSFADATNEEIRGRRRPRARPPVGRRRPDARLWATSGSTRASRPTPNGSGASAREKTRAGDLRRLRTARPRPRRAGA
jgi:hypothetical protein